METPWDDETVALLRRAKRGDRAAWSALFDGYRPELRDHVQRMLGHRMRQGAECADFLQDLFLDALQGLAAFEVRGGRQFARWLTAIVRNDVRDEARRPRERGLEGLSAEELVDDAPPPPRVAEERELRARFESALARLPAEHRRVVELRDVDGLRYGEIARRMGRTENAVQKLHARAVERLAAALGGADREGPAAARRSVSRRARRSRPRPSGSRAR